MAQARLPDWQVSGHTWRKYPDLCLEQGSLQTAFFISASVLLGPKTRF